MVKKKHVAAYIGVWLACVSFGIAFWCLVAWLIANVVASVF